MTQRDGHHDEQTVSITAPAKWLGLDGAQNPSGTRFGYDSADPFAVTISLETAGDVITWWCDREMLMEGLVSPVGEGDVHMWPTVTQRGRSVLVMELSTPEGPLHGITSAEEIYQFLSHSLRLVPLGDENCHLDLDALLARLLAV